MKEALVDFLKRSGFKQVATVATLLLIFSVLTGLAYPLLVSGLGNAVFPANARGSLVRRDGRVVGSTLIGQSFDVSGPYFQGRPSAAGDGYDAAASGGSNLGPTNDKLLSEVEQRAGRLRRANGLGQDTAVPADLVTASASGLDPHISPESAYVQVARVARARGILQAEVRALVTEKIEPRTLGILGEPRVNVLSLNLQLDERFGRPPEAGAPGNSQ